LVDAIGGVQVCAYTPIRDTHTGLYVAQPGCHVLDGFQGLAYARSRHFETYDVARTPGPRIRRRISPDQAPTGFINTALQGALAKVKGNPLTAVMCSSRAPGR